MGWLFGKKATANSQKTPIKTILSQMNDPRPLPMGQKEFEEWSERIISGALIPTSNPESLKGILCVFLNELEATIDHKPDGYFIKKLRNAAIKQVATANFQLIKQKRLDAAKAEEGASKPHPPVATVTEISSKSPKDSGPTPA